MIRLLRSLLSPIISIALLMFGMGFFMSFLSLSLNQQGYADRIVGYIQAAFFFGVMIGALYVERLIRRIGHIRAYATFGSICGASVLMQGIIPSFWVWMAARFFTGLSSAGIWICIESWLMEMSTTQTRGRVLAVYMIAFYFSQASGQFILDWVDQTSLIPFLVAGLLAMISVVPVSLTRYPSPVVTEPTIPNIFHIFSISPLGVSGCFLAGWLLSGIYSFTPIFARDMGLSVPLVMSVTIMGGMVLQWPIGKLSDIFDRRTILVLASLILVIPSFLIFLFPHQESFVLVFSFLLGGLSFTLYPLSITQVCDHFEAHNITAITGILLLAYGAGSSTGPLLAPLFIQPFGSEFLYIYLSLISLLLAAIGMASILFGKAIPQEEQQEYVPLPSSGTAAFELDPRFGDDSPDE